MQPKKGDATKGGDDLDSEAKWIRLTKQLFLDLAYMSLVSDWTSVLDCAITNQLVPDGQYWKGVNKMESSKNALENALGSFQT